MDFKEKALREILAICNEPPHESMKAVHMVASTAIAQCANDVVSPKDFGLPDEPMLTIKFAQTINAIDPSAPLGKDAKGNDLYIGDVVNHTEKNFLKDGIVKGKGYEYKGEPTVMVDFDLGDESGKLHLNRLSKLARA